MSLSSVMMTFQPAPKLLQIALRQVRMHTGIVKFSAEQKLPGVRRISTAGRSPTLRERCRAKYPQKLLSTSIWPVGHVFSALVRNCLLSNEFPAFVRI